MDTWIPEVTFDALARMQEHATLVGLPNTDEATFRSFFLASLRKRYAFAQPQTEWHTFDLLVQLDGRNTLVEFKYFIFRQTFELDGCRGQRKGGAGDQNEREFWDCVRKLHRCSHKPVDTRCLVLVYDPELTSPPRKSFEASYGDLSPGKLLAKIVVARQELLTCKILEVR